MTQYCEILRLEALGLTQSGIASSIGCSRKSVRNVLKRARELEIRWPLKQGTTDAEMERIFLPDKATPDPSRKYPDYEYIDKEMRRSGVTLKLLWSEYCEECRQDSKIPFMYSQLCFHYQKHAEQKRATMHILRKPGEQIEVDWAGDTSFIFDRDTGERTPCYIFVGVLNYSMYAYVEAFASMNMESWIAAHVNMYTFFGGAAKMLIPDNLRTGVSHSDWYTPEINKTYREMAEHYHTAVVPARVKAPKDKAAAENSVRVVSTWITAAIRNEKFFSISELNREIKRRLESFNSKSFQKKTGSRLSVFLADESVFLIPLPSNAYELAQWKQATVQFNYHISLDKMQYSVPYEYIKHKVDVRITRSVIEVFYNDTRICSHKRLYGYPGQYSTNEMHMPQNHQTYANWNGERFIEWSTKIGSCTATVVQSILASYKVEQQGYRACMGLLKLADKYSVNRLESACEKALSYTPHPSYKSVKNILATGQDKMTNEEPVENSCENAATHGYTRGIEYYGGK